MAALEEISRYSRGSCCKVRLRPDVTFSLRWDQIENWVVNANNVSAEVDESLGHTLSWWRWRRSLGHAFRAGDGVARTPVDVPPFSRLLSHSTPGTPADSAPRTIVVL